MRRWKLSWLVMGIMLWATAARASVTASASSYEVSQSQTRPVTAAANISRQGPGAPGSSSAAATATYAALASVSRVTGCGFELNNFQQPCNDARSRSTFDDTLAVMANAPNGTPVQLRATLTLTGSVDGIGGYSYNASAHINLVGDGIFNWTGGTVVTANNVSIDATRVWTVTVPVGLNVLVSGFLEGVVFNRYCAGGSQDCEPSESVWTMTLVAGATLHIEVLTPGLENVQMVGIHGHDYLAAPVAVGELESPRAALSAARPTPATSDVHLALTLAEPAPVDVGVFDVAGRRIATLASGLQPAGTRDLRWNGRDAAGREARGVFFVRASGTGIHLSRRVLMIR